MRLANRLTLAVVIPSGILAALLIAVAIHGQGSSTTVVSKALSAATDHLTTAQQGSLSAVTDRVVQANKESLLAKGQSLGKIAAGFAGESLILEDDSGIEKVSAKVLADDDCIGIWVTTPDGTIHAGLIDPELRDLFAALVQGAVTPRNVFPILGKVPNLPTTQVPVVVEKKTLGTVTVALSPTRLRQREEAVRSDLAQTQEQSRTVLEQTRGDLSSTLERTSSHILFILLGAGGACCLVLIPLGYLMGRRIARPVVTVGNALGAVAKGDYAQELPVVGSDELAELTRALNDTARILRDNQERILAQGRSTAEMNARLQSLMAQMQASAETTSTQAEVVSSNAQAVSAHVQSVSAAMTQMEAVSNEIAGNTSNAASIASEAAQDARRIDERVQALGESSKAIGAIISTIESIAARTTLLAFNATIEASKAGTAGRGFSVVAGEIRDLAQQTASATSDIRQRVVSIQGEVTTIMGDIQGITGTLERMDELQSGVATAIEEQTATTRGITTELGEATRGSHDIAQAVAEVAAAAKAVSRSLADQGS